MFYNLASLKSFRFLSFLPLRLQSCYRIPPIFLSSTHFFIASTLGQDIKLSTTLVMPPEFAILLVFRFWRCILICFWCNSNNTILNHCSSSCFISTGIAFEVFDHIYHRSCKLSALVLEVISKKQSPTSNALNNPLHTPMIFPICIPSSLFDFSWYDIALDGFEKYTNKIVLI